MAVASESPTDIDSQLDYVFKLLNEQRYQKKYSGHFLFLHSFRCDVSGDGTMDVKELATFLTASVKL